MTGILYIILAIFLLMFLFTIVQSIVGKLLGAIIDEIGIFLGPSIFKFNVGNLKISLNYIPTGSYVKFTDDFEKLAPIRKLLISISGLLFYLVIAVLCLGLNETFRHTINAYQQVFFGIISPVSVGAKYVEMLAQIMTQQSFLTGIGILTAKMLAISAIPLGTFTGGSVFTYLLELIGFKSQKLNERFGIIGLLFWLIIIIPWIIAILVFALRSLGIL